MSTKKSGTSWQDTISDWLVSIIVAVALAFCIRTFVVEPYMVEGTSMYPTLESHERLIVSKYKYFFTEPKKGEIVVFRYPKDESRDFIKRVYLDPAKLARYAIGNTTLATKLLAQGFTTMSGAVDNGKFVAPIHIPAGACYTSKRCGACRAGIFRAGFLHYEQRNEMFGPLYGDARGEQHRSNG